MYNFIYMTFQKDRSIEMENSLVAAMGQEWNKTDLLWL